MFRLSVTIRSVALRIELKNVTAVKLSEEEWGGVDIESFTVKGFYLNRVWLSGYLDPAEPDNRPISEAGHVVNQSEAAKYDKQAYADAKAPFLCDEPADGDMTYSGEGLADEEVYKVWQTRTSGGDICAFRQETFLPKTRKADRSM